jgi:hypothetical protein
MWFLVTDKDGTQLLVNSAYVRCIKEVLDPNSLDTGLCYIITEDNAAYVVEGRSFDDMIQCVSGEPADSYELELDDDPCDLDEMNSIDDPEVPDVDTDAEYIVQGSTIYTSDGANTGMKLHGRLLSTSPSRKRNKKPNRHR